MCVVLGDGVLDLIAALGDASVADVVGGGALALGGADAAGAFGGAESTSAGLGGIDDSTAIGNTPGGLSQASGDLSGGSGSTTSALNPVATGADGIPELTVTGAAPSSTGTLGAALNQVGSTIAPIAASGLSAAGAGGGGSGVPGSQQAGVNGPEGGGVSPSLNDQGPLLANNDVVPGGASDISNPFDSGGFLPATGDSSVQALSPDAMQSLGITPADTTNTALTDTSGAFDPSSVTSPDAVSVQGPSLADQAETKAGEFGKWLESPKNAATAGLLGLSAKNALTTPKLSAASQAAEANAAAEAKGALPIIQSGGTATPEWASQKASIDATINNQIQQQTEAIMQAAASSGEGGQNSGIVQQQIAAMTQQANLQRQQLYSQAQAQNVQQAVSEISGGDSTLTSIGSTQLQQSEQAQQLAAQTAEMALLLQTGQKLPGQGTGAGPLNAGS
jgi:hypothetical protein